MSLGERIEGAENPVDELEQIIDDAWRDAVSPSEGEQPLEAHAHHLIREAETTQTLDADLAERNDLDPDIVELVADLPLTWDVQAEHVHYCFTCGEWIERDLRGHLRSTEDAFYYMGPPPAVQELREDAADVWSELILRVALDHPHIHTHDDAAEFLKTQVDNAADTLTAESGSEQLLGGEDE